MGERNGVIVSMGVDWAIYLHNIMELCLCVVLIQQSVINKKVFNLSC